MCIRDRLEGPSLEEVVNIIKSLKNNKAPGCDTVTAYLLKYRGKSLRKRIHKILELIWHKETMPENWKLGLIHPVHKKGDKQACENYRGIMRCV